MYYIDRDKSIVNSEYEITNPKDINNDLDLIIVTPVMSFDEIESVLRTKVTCGIVSIEDILFSL